MSRIDEIKARAEAATPGPWDVYVDIWEDPKGRRSPRPWIFNNDGQEDQSLLTPKDLLFINHARDDIHYLLAEVERLQKRVAELEQITGQCPDCGHKQTLEYLKTAVCEGCVKGVLSDEWIY